MGTWSEGILLTAILVPFACLWLLGVYLQLQAWKIYHRMGKYSIGRVAFFWQLRYPGVNFPGPNVLEAEIAAQSADFQDQVRLLRRRRRHFDWAIWGYVALVLTAGITFRLLQKSGT